MIVKNEAHVIEETLNNLKNYICYWVISDTGSTDETKEIITNFFKKENIPGELVEHEWEDFGTNRTYALEACWKHRKHFDYIWVFDADDLVKGNLVFPKVDDKIDFYSIKYGHGFTYMRNQIFKSSLKWRYVGVLHEYPECVSKKTVNKGVIEGDYYIESRRLGDRNKAEDKYIRDAEILEKGLIKEPDNERYMFYLGQSYMDARDYKKAIEWYTKRVERGKWFEEVYYSLYRIATCMERDGQSWEDVENAYMKAWKFLPSRAEPLYEIAKHYRLERNFEKGYKYAKLASTIPFPKDQVLFLFKSVYDYQVLDELSICAYYVGKHRENIDCCKRLIREGFIPKEQIARIKKNMEYSTKALSKSDGKKRLIFYVGYSIFEEEHIYGSELALMNLATQLSTSYDITVFGKNLKNNTIKGIPFLNSNSLESFFNNNEVDVCIISRYVHYLIEFPIKARKNYIWLHDICYHGAYNGFVLPDNGKILVENSLDKINGIVTLTNWHKQLIMNHYSLSPHKLAVIGNGVNETFFQEDFEQLEKIPYRLIYTSDVCRGLEQLVDYFVEIRKEFPKAELYVYRDETSFKDYPVLLKKIKKNKHIHYSGKLEQKDLIHEFEKSDLWVYPTTFPETFCMSGLEALRAGCYCISTSLAALKETIGEHGILIEGDPKTKEGKERFLEEIRKAFTNEDYRKEIQKRAFEHAKTQTWKHIGEEWLKMME